MKMKRKLISTLLVISLLAGCSKNTVADTEQSNEPETTEQTTTVDNTLAKIDQAKWQYNEEDDVYWQVGISYCSNPADTQYETLGIFVPGAYMEAKDNGDGTYTCTVNTEAKVGNYTADTAPVVIPVDTPGYAAMAAPTDYNSQVSEYTKAGFVYVHAGCRGRDAGAPAGVTDLKAAVRYIRYNEGEMPGSMERIFTFGMSGGGAQSALMGATGDSELYTPYLEAIGAVSGVSDAVAGSMCWCPVTNLDYANEAYEWNMGVTRTDLDDDTQKLSDEMAEAFANYINEIGLKDEDGNVLTLAKSDEGIYQSGSYYEYLKSVVEQSLNNFLEDTTFPYTVQSSGKGGMRGGMDGEIGEGGRGDFKDKGELPDGELPDKGELPDGELPDKGELPDGELPDKGELPDGELPDKGELPDGELPDKGNFKDGDLKDDDAGNTEENGDITERDGINRNETSGGVDLSGTYETVQDYIDALNADTEWVSYDKKTNTATITSIADFVTACKNASKNVGAFDDLDGSQGENTLFGYGDGNGAHFDSIMAELLADNEEYGEAYKEDLEKTDALGNTVDYRLNMYNPMYYLSDYYEGYGQSNVAKYWRIRTGINQSDTALSTEVNLSLALLNYDGTEVDFETVWGQGHVEAERTGDSTSNFIEWVNDCLE